ncbi:heme/copper-type cytochrome/quinol oxidase subunit 2 [Paenarthrobacter ilicis]|uniref:Heme/copper-type cytochrome/quinol oxidase subunit 2 n=1 Tax=Paenarthrobacter ilicis TaxID=43665 RepID=A0ABX0TS29_9MICC|nr:heme/copper-type cytochrome/quinol oxidase subunit 2 [Paenarthrobacter ilicis]
MFTEPKVLVMAAVVLLHILTASIVLVVTALVILSTFAITHIRSRRVRQNDRLKS